MRAKIAFLASAAIALTLGLSSLAVADHDGNRFTARLNGYQEVPAVSSTGQGRFEARINDNNTITYTLTYEKLEGVSTLFAHIHLGQRSVNGGVSAFLCGGGGKPACTPTRGSVTGTIGAADVIGPAGQGIALGEFAELVRAMRAGVTYANVHTDKHPGGEIRGHLVGRGGDDRRGDDGDDDDD